MKKAIGLFALCISIQGVYPHQQQALTTRKTDAATLDSKGIIPQDKTVCVTIPKCGTHLLLKCLALMDPIKFNVKFDNDLHPEKWYYERDKPRNQLPPPNHYKGFWHSHVDGPIRYKLVDGMRRSTKRILWNHFNYTKEYNAFLDSYGTHGFKKILMLRDPRAMLVSFARMVQPGFEPGQEIELEPLILDLIDGRQQNYIPWAVSRHTSYPTMWEIGLCKFYESYLGFIKSNNCLTIRFEDLVGSKGGGSSIRQVNTIKQIAQFLGVTLTQEKLQYITKNLFGNTSTFNQGQIDGWKKYFTPTIKEAFKKAKGNNELLIFLGYEKDANW